MLDYFNLYVGYSKVTEEPQAKINEATEEIKEAIHTTSYDDLIAVNESSSLSIELAVKFDLFCTAYNKYKHNPEYMNVLMDKLGWEFSSDLYVEALKNNNSGIALYLSQNFSAHLSAGKITNLLFCEFKKDDVNHDFVLYTLSLIPLSQIHIFIKEICRKGDEKLIFKIAIKMNHKLDFNALEPIIQYASKQGIYDNLCDAIKLGYCRHVSEAIVDSPVIACKR